MVLAWCMVLASPHRDICLVSCLLVLHRCFTYSGVFPVYHKLMCKQLNWNPDNCYSCELNHSMFHWLHCLALWWQPWLLDDICTPIYSHLFLNVSLCSCYLPQLWQMSIEMIYQDKKKYAFMCCWNDFLSHAHTTAYIKPSLAGLDVH